MNFITGRSLDELFLERPGADAPSEAAPGEPASLLRLFMKICDAANAAHLRGITHRDLSPANILIDERGEPHILDFGLARTAFDRSMTRGGRDVSITGQFLGKLAYASPEQARGNVETIDIRTDVYALGVILYQIVTGGRFPYEVVGSIADVLNNIIHTKPTPPSRLCEGQDAGAAAADARRVRRQHPPVVNETIENIVLRALEKQPADRYQSAGELARDVGNYLAGRPTFADSMQRERPPRNEVTQEQHAPQPHADRRASFTVKPKSWKRTVLLGVLAGAITAGGCGIAYAVRYYSTLWDIQSRTMPQPHARP
jgi:serine/threonine protein kinase